MQEMKSDIILHMKWCPGSYKSDETCFRKTCKSVRIEQEPESCINWSNLAVNEHS